MSEHPEPEVAGQHDVSRTDRVQQAVEAFVELHTAGKAPDPMTFAAGHPQDLRAEILSQCREFLTFDGMLGHQEWQQDEPDEPGGRLFGDFVIQEELGRGGMGVVYRVEHVRINKLMAMKLLHGALARDREVVKR
ncbi:MAG: hypothetical protein KAI24_11675, partial [Planctomycetes bacterium]|nr:hypothetical protein [Planctomycetota bacterium]